MCSIFFPLILITLQWRGEPRFTYWETGPMPVSGQPSPPYRATPAPLWALWVSLTASPLFIGQKIPHIGNFASAGHSFGKLWIVDQSVPKAEHTRARSNTEHRLVLPALPVLVSRVKTDVPHPLSPQKTQMCRGKKTHRHKARVTAPPEVTAALIRASILPDFPGHRYIHTHFTVVLSPGLQLTILGTSSHKHKRLSTLVRKIWI